MPSPSQTRLHLLPSLPCTTSLLSLTKMVTVSLLILLSATVTEARNFAFFNSTSLITIPNSQWALQSTKQVTFRTCSDSGNLISMRGSLLSSSSSSSSSSSASSSSATSPTSNSQELVLSLYNTSVVFVWSINGQSDTVTVGHNINNNKWCTVRLKYLLGAVQLSVSQEPNVLNTVVIANSTFNSFLLDVRLFGNLTVGERFTGCMYQGPGVSFSQAGLIPRDIAWDECPLSQRQGCSYVDQDIDDCWKSPCLNGATCVDAINNYTCVCAPNFSGFHCENDLASQYGCAVQPCLNGGTCTEQPESPQNPRKFKCDCADGYTGVICESTIDVCRTDPCEHGTCISGINTYTCNCSGTGYSGDNCTVDINECEGGNPCGVGTCFNGPGGFSCDCPGGFDGSPCVEVNECLSQPCKNGGTCTDGLNAFNCSCLQGYTGLTCEENINDCVGNPCTAPNSKCVDLLNTYRCECVDGFSGSPPNCQDIDECGLGVCKNGAACSNAEGSYSCACLPGYTGQNCSVNIDDCTPNPCQNNATCNDQVNDYNCTCLPGFTGRNCQTNTDECKSNLCRNGARCEDQVNDYKCVCQPGWTGGYCETDINECDPNPCQNGAECHNLLNDFNCTCKLGFDGRTCSNNINDCAPNPCQNGGECFDGINSYSCNCTSDWMGKNCSEEYDACSFQPCRNGATCTTLPRLHNYTCVCPPGFTGKNCEENINDCRPDSCQIYQQCYDGINDFTCGCPIGYTGAICETEINECDALPCQNNATCQDGRGNYTCTCKQEYIDITGIIGEKGRFLSGYTGKNCEIDIDECAYSDPPICQAQGLCENDPKGGFTCYCKSTNGQLYTGRLCEQVRSYCDIRLPNQTCQNGGTCVNQVSGSVCRCAPGFTGDLCATNIDECEPQPCQYGGTCKDGINSYVCTCIDGITGPNCETNIDDCEPDPCLNNGVCEDHINSFTCNCTDTGFNGTTCETNIDDCVGVTCQHGGTCRDGVKDYTCDCLRGYTGRHCETDILECSPNPCQYGSLCYEYSNQTLYDKGDPNFVNFTYEKAAGYLCVCVPGVTGVNCSKDIDECDSLPCLNGATCRNILLSFQCDCAPGYEDDVCGTEINECRRYVPCKNGGVCVDKIADYECQCPAPVPNAQNYGGKNCTTYLRGCDRNNPPLCRNGDCIPKLVSFATDIRHDFDCACHPGYTGRFCDQPTDVNFKNSDTENAYIMKEFSTSAFDLNLRFRTTLSNTVLLLCKLSSSAYVAVELNEGKVHVKYKDNGLHTWTLPTQTLVNDTFYHQLQLQLMGNIVARLPLDRCTNGSLSSQDCQLTQPFVGSQNKFVRWMYIGSASMAGFQGESFPNNYVGCMEDIVVNQYLYRPGQLIGDYFGVGMGCPRNPQCLQDSCNGHGSCEDLWYTFRCHCYRPYYGSFCEQEYQSATFGQHSETFATYSFPPSGNMDNWTISFFLITRQDEGFISYTGNIDFSNSERHSYVVLYIRDGQLAGDFYKCEYLIQFNTGKRIDDGQRHFVSMNVQNENFKVMLNSELIYVNASVPTSSAVCPMGYGFYVREMTLGRYRNPNSRKKRDVQEVQEKNIAQESLVLELERHKRQTSSSDSLLQKYASMPEFQGVVQDIQVNDHLLSFNEPDSSFLRPDNSNLTVGAESTRNVCQDGPCENGGTCTDKFYNDFECACVRGYTGKNCSEPDFCSYGTCPAESTCNNLQDGYECISTAYFNEDTSMVSYRFSGAIPEPVLTFHFRTRGMFGLIFLLRQGDYYFKVRVAKGRLEVNRKLTAEFSKTVTTRNSRRFDDGQWYSVSFEIINGTHMKLLVYKEDTSNGFEERILQDETDLVEFETGNINVTDMLINGEIILGNTDRVKYSLQWEANFKGCLNEVRMGGVLMPFFPDNMFENNTVANKFLARPVEIVPHCVGADVCSNHVCMNGGQCKDLWNAYVCQCLTGFEGKYCEVNPDNCLGLSCENNGRCVDGPGNYSCMCPKGYSGDKCQTAPDLCNVTNASMCMNNATCEPRVYDFKCNCADSEFTGWYCNVSARQDCNATPCSRGTCSDTMITIGADSNVSSFNCTCPPGYEGPLCEKAIDYCNINGVVCGNNAQCVNHPEHQNYTCICDNALDFEGVNCTTEIDNCRGVICGNGRCEDGIRDHACVCDQGYTGQSCETLIDLCQNTSVCQHGRCEKGKCNCIDSGWEGLFCGIEVDECEKSNNTICMHGGSCNNTEGSFNCTCTLGYEGKTCDSPNCTGVCQNGATCIIDGGEWSCQCPKHIEGRVCDMIGPCYYNPCAVANTDICEQSIEYSNYTCNCKKGWRGQNCSEDIDECNETDAMLREQCVNGTCQNTDGSYNCICERGYTGRYCETEINECDPPPCKNNGLCTDLINNFTCNCNDTGYEGPTCETDIDECEKDSKKCNDGQCINTEGSYMCDCGDMYLGKHCEFVNPCNSTVCLNNGVCVVNQTTDGKYEGHCDCVDEYEGPLCEKKPRAEESSDDEDLGVIIGPIVGGVLFIIIIIVIIAFVMTARSKRATRGAYSPSQQETSGSRVELGNVLKKPPEERLI